MKKNKRLKSKMARGLASVMLVLLMLQLVLPYVGVTAVSDYSVLKLSNPDASRYTKELFAYLKGLGGDEILFGQQHAIDEGLTLTNDGNRVASEQSEVKNAVGNYPAIFGWDTNSLDGRERPGNAIGDVALSYEERLSNLAASMKKAHELGGIVTLSMHPNNFVTGGNYGDTSGQVVKAILPGGDAHDAFNAWLDQIVDLSHRLVDGNGEAIPMIFRPFHEQTGSWFWWGQSSTTPEDYKAIFRYTVDYLHARGNNNILIGYSPGSGPSGDKDRYFETYPGDKYVDILGIDSYDNKSNAGSDAWINSVAGDLEMLAIEAEARGKVSALTEFGYSAQGMNETGNNLEWWTKVLEGIMNNELYPKAKETSYMLTWANFGFPNNMYVPYRDVNGNLGGDHELLPDFQAFHDDERTVFASEGDVYNQGVQYETYTYPSDMYVVRPTNGVRVTESPTTLSVKVNGGKNPQVTYQVTGADEVDMVPVGEFYEAEYIPAAKDNNGSIDVIYRYYEGEELIDEDTHRYFITVNEIVVKGYPFDETIDGIKSNGTYSDQSGDAPELIISHSDFNGGALKLDVENMDPTVWWQELKLELTDIEDVDLMAVNRVNYDLFVPVTAGEKSLANVVMLPPDWEKKYTQEVNVADYDSVSIDSSDYYRVEVSVDVPKVEGAESLAISLVGKQMTFDDAFYIDNIQLINTFEEVEANPYVVDDFEGYMGENTLLNRAYSTNGDPIVLALSETEKYTGNYGLEFDYTLGSAGYAGRQTSLGTVDWSESNGVSFWLKHEAQGERRLTVQIQMGGVSFESNVELAEAFEGMVDIPFSAFSPAHWEGNQQAIIDSSRIQKVTQFALYMGGETGSGTLYFDDIKATTIPGAPDVPGAKDPGEQVIEPIYYMFDDSLEGFSAPGFNVIDGYLTGEVKLDGKKEINRAFGQSLEGYQYLVARIKYTSQQPELEALKAKLFIKTGDAWSWSDSGEVTLVKDAFVDVIFDLSAVEDLNAVRELGIEFIGASTGEATVYIDHVSIVESLDQLPGVTPDEEDTPPGEDDAEGEGDTPPGEDDAEGEGDTPPGEGDAEEEGNTPPSEGDAEGEGDTPPGEGVVVDESGNALPGTATSNFNIMLVAGLLLLCGGSMIVIERKRRVL
ncbi:hypothetical protein GCM10012290_04880 [Halolactibacillus alkaliphilus]|uniref:GH26 domain-containing protein n=1 Tax=Halolactibacillus alkaliphilus TaxID=442899 RepID=A0A511WYW6_9BACI|nr:glycosyl hydrolase [Halolactibacillus alkaliphilus]GEN55878.1 hypothetical protein HAL01_03420 [Halolactibacillus alkaliphilus]GGN65789.1 hypothetical protein GCM10012290_04880 [Halolactibacillus alkaliphilus]SFO66265.1 mannan endo-1,4-beta-mannosidase [Halolactibacillus alkaliphilus]